MKKTKEEEKDKLIQDKNKLFRDNEKKEKEIKKLNQTIDLNNKQLGAITDANIEFTQQIKENKKNLNRLNTLRASLSLNFDDDEKIMCVIFQNQEQSIHYPVICTNKMIFNNVTNKLFEEYPQYKESFNFFLVNGNQIFPSKTIEENGIKYGDVIMLSPLET